MATFIKIASVTVGSGGSSTIDFTSIPAIYDDIIIFASLRDTNAGGVNAALDGAIKLNDATTNYSWRRIIGDGSAASSAAAGAGVDPYIVGYVHPGGNATAGTFGSYQIYIPNYRTSQNKSVSFDGTSENNNTKAYASFYAGLWANTAAITKVSIITLGTAFAQHSTATLYGIKNS
jgi:hypothetical protein